MLNSVQNKAAVPPAATKPAAAKAAEPQAVAPAGDTLSLSRAAEASSEAGKTVTIDGKTYVLKESDPAAKPAKRKWPLWEKLATFVPTGLVGLLGGYITLSGVAMMSPTGAFTLGMGGLLAAGVALSAGVGFGIGRALSWVGRKVAG